MFVFCLSCWGIVVLFIIPIQEYQSKLITAALFLNQWLKSHSLWVNMLCPPSLLKKHIELSWKLTVEISVISCCKNTLLSPIQCGSIYVYIFYVINVCIELIFKWNDKIRQETFGSKKERKKKESRTKWKKIEEIKRNFN